MEMCASNRELSRPTHRARVTESKRERERGGGLSTASSKRFRDARSPYTD